MIILISKNKIFDITNFKEQILSHSSPKDKFIIIKLFDDIGEAYGFHNEINNSKTAADALLTLHSIDKNDERSTLQK